MKSQDNQVSKAQVDDDEINLIDMLLVIAKYNRFILMFTAVSAVLALVYALRQPVMYTAKAIIMPPQSSTSTASQLLGQLGNLGLGSGSGSGSGGIPFLIMLKSRTLAYQLIERLKLQALYKTKNMEAARAVLSGYTNITSTKDGLITIEYSDKDPKLSALIANTYVEELDIINSKIAVTDASRKRLFFEKQVNLASVALANAEVALKETQKLTDFGQLEAQGGALLGVAATLRGQITAKEIELTSLRGYATEKNPEYQRALAAIAALRAQLAKADSNNEGYLSDGESNNKSSTAGSDYLHKAREVKYQEAILESLRKQFELARLDEAKDASLIQVLESALVPEQPSKPKREVILTVATLAAFFISIFLAFIMDGLERAKKNPVSVERLNLLYRYLRRGK